MSAPPEWAFAVAVIGVPIAILVAVVLVLHFQKRKLMRRLGEALGVAYDPTWIFSGEGDYGTVRGAIHGREFKVWAVNTRGGGHTNIKMPCKTQALADALAWRSVGGNFDLYRVFPDEVDQAIQKLLSGQAVPVSDVAIELSRGGITFSGHELEWRGGGFCPKNPERFAPVIPVLACVATCLENPDIQRRFIGMAGTFLMGQRKIR